MGNSTRHHYIPQFLIKNFTDADGLLHVYNKINDRIVNTRQSPKAIFFERDRNTVDFSGHKLDNLEKMYAELDGKISPDLQNILSNKSISPDELVSVMLLASQLKWRVPKIDERFNEIKNDLTQNELSISISVKGENTEVDKDAIEHIENSDIFKETKRVMLAILPLLNEQSLLKVYENCFINSNPVFPSLISDNPVLERENDSIHTMEDFIFPLSSTDTFIFKKGSSKKINNVMFFFQRDLAIIDSSSKYVACKSREYLEKMVKMYHIVKNKNKMNNVTKFLFDCID